MNMKWISRSTVFAVLLCIVALSAQAQMQMPKPSPELKKLDYFVGDWKTDATMTPGGKFAASDHSEWLGEFFLINHSKFTSPFGPGTEVEIMSYDPVGEVYSYDSFSSSGRHEIAKGTLDGDTWTWTSDLNMGGQSNEVTLRRAHSLTGVVSFRLSNVAGWRHLVDGHGRHGYKRSGDRKKVGPAAINGKVACG